MPPTPYTENSRISVVSSEYFLIFGPSVRAQRLSRAASILTFQSGSIRAIRRSRFQVRIPETLIFTLKYVVWGFGTETCTAIVRQLYVYMAIIRLYGNYTAIVRLYGNYTVIRQLYGNCTAIIHLYGNYSLIRQLYVYTVFVRLYGNYTVVRQLYGCTVIVRLCGNYTINRLRLTNDTIYSMILCD